MRDSDYAGIAEVLDANIPNILKRRPQWVNWRYESRGEDRTKVPYTPGTESRAASDDLMTWRSFFEAVAGVVDESYEGVGFVFCSADPFVGIDLDKCRDPETEAVEEWATLILDTFANPVIKEVSPSGTGIHVIARGRVNRGVKTPKIEVYGQGRYFTVTGWWIA